MKRMSTVTSMNWMDRKACSETNSTILDNDLELPYPSNKVRQLCGRCLVKDHCLAWGLDTEYGIYGGLTGYQREQLRAKRQRVRCPGCSSQLTAVDREAQCCISCGLSWRK